MSTTLRTFKTCKTSLRPTLLRLDVPVIVQNGSGFLVIETGDGEALAGHAGESFSVDVKACSNTALSCSQNWESRARPVSRSAPDTKTKVYAAHAMMVEPPPISPR